MSKRLRVLMVEASEDNTVLLVRELQNCGFDLYYNCVETAAAMADALHTQPWDLIISDYSLPQFDGLAALQMVKESGLDIPFLFVSGIAGEETAVAAMRAGAGDYLVKGNLTRLASAIERELREADVRRRSKQALRSLQESEARFRSLSASSPVGIFQTDAAGQAVYTNERCQGILGLTLEESLGEGWAQAIHPEDRAALLADWAAAIQQGGEFSREFRLTSAAGDLRWAHARAVALRSPDGEITGYGGVLEDVTAQHEEHEALKHSKRDLERMVSNVPGMMFRVLISPDGAAQYTCVSDACRELFGVLPEQFQSGELTVHDLVHPEDYESFDSASAPMGATPQPWEWRGRCVLPTGELKVIQALFRPDREEKGGLMWDGLLYEVTLQVEAEREAAQLAHIVNSSGEAIISETLGGVITSWNSAAEKMYGYTAAEMIGQPIERLMPPDRPYEISNLRERIAHGESIPSYDTVRLTRDGSLLDVSVTLSPIRDSPGHITGIATIEHDIRPRKRLEDQLLQAQKLESVGRLAGGVAHDFNNLLTVILGNAALAQEEGSLPSPLEEYLRNITQAVEKAAALTQQLLAFARRQVIEPRCVNLNDVILSLDKMLRRLITESIELVMLPAEHLNTVKVDPSQFAQILVNLVVNARDAMPQGGKITIETYNTTLDEDYSRHHDGVTPGEYVVFTISDTGGGMDEAIRLHIFEPFFTTKEKGRGTGLGLSTVYGIVKQAGGHIWLYSEVGEGTTFKIYLPRTSAVPETLGEADVDVEPGGGSETILLVEDEPNVRAFALQALQRRGYTVLEAMNGEEALRLVSGREEEIALLITDVVMPRMSGKELADRLQGLHPGLKVLYVSGYTENTIVHHGVLEAGIVFLSKPFTPSMLARRVRELLDDAEETFP